MNTEQKVAELKTLSKGQTVFIFDEKFSEKPTKIKGVFQRLSNSADKIQVSVKGGKFGWYTIDKYEGIAPAWNEAAEQTEAKVIPMNVEPVKSEEKEFVFPDDLAETPESNFIDELLGDTLVTPAPADEPTPAPVPENVATPAEVPAAASASSALAESKEFLDWAATQFEAGKTVKEISDMSGKTVSYIRNVHGKYLRKKADESGEKTIYTGKPDSKRYKVIELLDAGIPAKEIAKSQNVHLSYVYYSRQYTLPKPLVSENVENEITSEENEPQF